MLGSAMHSLGAGGTSNTRILLVGTTATSSPNYAAPVPNTKIYLSDDSKGWAVYDAPLVGGGTLFGVDTKGIVMSANNLFYSFPNNSLPKVYYTSPDGLVWTTRTNTYSIVYQSDLDRVYGYQLGYYSKRYLDATTTADQLVWTPSTIPPSTDNSGFWGTYPSPSLSAWNGVYWSLNPQVTFTANGLHVRVTKSDGNAVYIEHSPDNITWTRSLTTLPYNALVWAVQFLIA